MDVDEDSDQFSKTPAPLVETAWVYIGIKERDNPLHESIMPLNYKRVPTCARFFLLFRAPGVVLKDRMHISTYWKGPQHEKT